MKSNDYVSYITKTVVTHLQTPKEERKQRKNEKKLHKEPFAYKWFGILPYSMKASIEMMKRPKK
nr:YqzE family protein [Bacillus andreraoultii]